MKKRIVVVGNGMVGHKFIDNLVNHADATADVRADCRAQDAQFREGTPAKNETGTEHDVERISEPQRSHGQHCIARASKDSVDEEDQKDREVASQHGSSERGA